jgi:hypothetical protein
MRRTPLLLLSILALSITACGQRGAGSNDPVDAWNDSIMAALGGERAWDKTRYLQFRWVALRGGQVTSDRMHYWDRKEGRSRLEMIIRGPGTVMGRDQSLTALLDTNTGEGRVWIDEQEFEGAMGQQLLERAHAWFVNDSYWLLMPYRWREPGVKLEHQGPLTDDDGDWQVFQVAFDEDGLETMRADQYWVYVSAQAPHLIGKWQYHLKGRDGNSAVIRWEDWQEFGNILLATSRQSVERGLRIEFRDILVSDAAPEDVFQAPGSIVGNW